MTECLINSWENVVSKIYVDIKAKGGPFLEICLAQAQFDNRIPKRKSLYFLGFPACQAVMASPCIWNLFPARNLYFSTLPIFIFAKIALFVKYTNCFPFINTSVPRKLSIPGIPFQLRQILVLAGGEKILRQCVHFTLYCKNTVYFILVC